MAEGPLGPDLGLDLDQGGSDPSLILGLTGPSAASGQRPPLAVEGCDPLRLAATAAHLLPGSEPGGGGLGVSPYLPSPRSRGGPLSLHGVEFTDAGVAAPEGGLHGVSRRRGDVVVVMVRLSGP